MNCRNEEEAHDMAFDQLSEGEVLFLEGMEMFEDDTCLENILR
jgi:hypothetical protein